MQAAGSDSRSDRAPGAGSPGGPSEAGGREKGPLKPAYLILGDDEPKVEKALRRLKLRITAAATDSGDLNIDEFQADEGNSVDVINAANTMAFLGGLRLVLVHDVHRWSEEDERRIVAYLASPAPDACLALVGEKLPATNIVRTAVAKVGDVLEYDAPRKAKFTDWVLNQAARLRLDLGSAEARMLIERIGEHQHMVLRELEKLAVYAGPGRVTAADIEAVCSRTPEASIFELVDALAAGEGAAAFRSLEELYDAGEKPAGLFYRVLWHFEKLAAMTALRSEGVGLEEAQRALKLKPYPAKKLWKQTEVLGPEHIRRIIRALATADARMKGMSPLSGEADLAPRLEFELCLGAILSVRRA